MREYYFNMPSIQRIEKDLRDRRAKALPKGSDAKVDAAVALAMGPSILIAEGNPV
jgi:ABC-type branched-subunit amino acid transport system ATPase component